MSLVRKLGQREIKECGNQGSVEALGNGVFQCFQLPVCGGELPEQLARMWVRRGGAGSNSLGTGSSQSPN